MRNNRAVELIPPRNPNKRLEANSCFLTKGAEQHSSQQHSIS
jgi:hypothetical protein